MIIGKHLIGGKWHSADTVFSSECVDGQDRSFPNGMVTLVNLAVSEAENAFLTFGQSIAAVRADLLEAIAKQIDSRGADITKIGVSETGLPPARLDGERGRTIGQLRMFRGISFRKGGRANCPRYRIRNLGQYQ